MPLLMIPLDGFDLSVRIDIIDRCYRQLAIPSLLGHDYRLGNTGQRNTQTVRFIELYI